MNLGVYIKNNSENELTKLVSSQINDAVRTGDLDDACLFYDVVGPNKLKYSFGAFNSTDIWNFTGDLFTFDIESSIKASNMVNKFNIYMYFGLLPEKDLMGLLHSVNDLKINVICSDESAQKEFVRLTGKKPLATIQNFDVKEIKKVIQ
tara:strand:+ start:1180 stop:1626 length:447 start_codon:yes stop_codon:yes gene_type:complete